MRQCPKARSFMRRLRLGCWTDRGLHLKTEAAIGIRLRAAYHDIVTCLPASHRRSQVQLDAAENRPRWARLALGLVDSRRRRRYGRFGIGCCRWVLLVNHYFILRDFRQKKRNRRTLFAVFNAAIYPEGGARLMGFLCPAGAKNASCDRFPRVALRPPGGGLRSTRGYTPSTSPGLFVGIDIRSNFGAAGYTDLSFLPGAAAIPESPPSRAVASRRKTLPSLRLADRSARSSGRTGSACASRPPSPASSRWGRPRSCSRAARVPPRKESG